MITVGVDEVGRGCWAGPLVAAAVILPANLVLEDGPIKLRDSKKLTKRQREIAAEFIERTALAVGVGWVWPEAIDSGGITQAVKSAMQKAVAAIEIEYSEVIIDGNINYLKDSDKFISASSATQLRTMVGADDLIPAVSAASIIAKVARDNYMAEVAAQYPEYGFANHVGYGTTEHITALRTNGVTAIHRKSYKPIRALLELGQ